MDIGEKGGRTGMGEHCYISWLSAWLLLKFQPGSSLTWESLGSHRAATQVPSCPRTGLSVCPRCDHIPPVVPLCFPEAVPALPCSLLMAWLEGTPRSLGNPSSGSVTFINGAFQSRYAGKFSSAMGCASPTHCPAPQAASLG